jgi:cytidine deaminase
MSAGLKRLFLSFFFMEKISNVELINLAKKVTLPMQLYNFSTSGTVGCALITTKGNIFTGICMDVTCGIGVCAEHVAIANMLATGEKDIEKIVAVSHEGKILPPCGRCRELIYAINPKNLKTKIIIGKEKVTTLKEIFPLNWQTKY